MKRTTISLPDELAAALEREARLRRVSVSQVAREAIEARLGLDEEEPPDMPWIGIGDSGLPGIAEDDEEYLRQHWAGDLEADGLSRRR